MADLEPAPRQPTHEDGATSIYSLVPFEQDTSFLIIGERTNANGSKKFRDALLEGDWDGTVADGQGPGRARASHILDLCVDYVGRDGTADMDEIASRFCTQSSVPLVLDSTEPQVMEAGLQWMGGRAILNSANLEDGDGEGQRLDRVMKLAREYGAAVICLLIDEEGQARDVEWKMRIAHRIHDLAVDRYGLEPGDLIFDALTFPLSTGDDDLRRDAIATIEAIRRIKDELPGVYTTLGVSNVSLRPEAGRPPRAQLGVPRRVRRGRSRLGHRPRQQDPAAQPDPRRAARRWRSTSSTTAAAPTAATAPTRSTTRSPHCSRSSRTSRSPTRSKRTGRTGRSSSGSRSASSTASATAWPTTSTRRWTTARRPSTSSTTPSWPA